MSDTSYEREVMEDFDNGERVEVAGNHNRTNYVKCNDPVWNWDDFHYRIKKEPRKIWVNVYDTHEGNITYSLSESISRANTCPSKLIERIMYVEAVDDEKE